MLLEKISRAEQLEIVKAFLRCTVGPRDTFQSFVQGI